MTKGIRVFGVALLAAITACGVEITAGGAREGEVDAVVTSQDEGPSASGAHTPLYSSSGSSGTGRIEVDAAVVLISEGGAEVRLSTGLVSGSFRIEGDDEALIGSGRVAARRYTRARLTFTRVEAHLSSGFPVLGTVAVDIQPGAPVVVERAIDLEVRRNARQVLVVDLNAASWLGTASPLTRLVSPAAFRSAVEVSVR
jgi:hypothetical protein